MRTKFLHGPCSVRWGQILTTLLNTLTQTEDYCLCFWLKYQGTGSCDPQLLNPSILGPELLSSSTLLLIVPLSALVTPTALLTVWMCVCAGLVPKTKKMVVGIVQPVTQRRQTE